MFDRFKNSWRAWRLNRLKGKRDNLEAEYTLNVARLAKQMERLAPDSRAVSYRRMWLKEVERRIVLVDDKIAALAPPEAVYQDLKVARSHTMHLNSEAAERMKAGIKKIEARLNDETRQKVEVGDIIHFVDSNHELLLRVEVTVLLPYLSFDALLDDYDSQEYFGRAREELLARLRKPTGYYSAEDEQNYGVLGIIVKVIDA